MILKCEQIKNKTEKKKQRRRKLSPVYAKFGQFINLVELAARAWQTHSWSELQVGLFSISLYPLRFWDSTRDVSLG